MKKFLVGLVILLLALAVFLLFPTNKINETEVQKPKIKIGIILPLTGDSQILGKAAEQAILLAKEDLQKKGLKNNYEFIFEDADVFSIRKTSNAVNKLINADKVDALFTYFNTPGGVAGRALQGTDILHFNYGNDHTSISGNNDFRYYSSMVSQSKWMLNLMKENGAKNIALLICNTAYGNLFAQEFSKLAKDYGINILTTEFANTGERDFRTILERIEKQNPDMYFFQLETPEKEIARKVMLELNIKTPITTAEGFESTAQRELFEGMPFVSFYEGDKDFISRFKKYSELENIHGAPHVYDMINVMITGFEQQKDCESISDSIHRIKTYNGVAGEAIQENNFFRTKDLGKVIKNGEVVIID
ncbi:MAG: ABC transporter substrate-binding protein [Lactobacillus sp.]|jgi:branched-chain amino acid transport system substrate-binding protein|nr:ABC transporter substrate-binding protein [Lactobacillus sp.]